MKKHKTFFILFTLLALVVIALAVILTSDWFANLKESKKEPSKTEVITDNGDTPTPEVTPEPEPEPEPQPEPAPEFEEYDLHLLALGDNLFHMGVVNGGLQDDGSYNYDMEFEGIAEFLEFADIKIINQETPMAGNDRGFSGYPSFNTPTQVGDAIAKAEFNVVLGATNHAYDQGLSGLKNFYNFFRDTYPNILICGIHGDDTDPSAPQTVTEISGKDNNAAYYEYFATHDAEGFPLEEGAISLEADTDVDSEYLLEPEADYSRINLLEIDGFTFAILNYTYGNNWGTFPYELEGHLDTLCTWNSNREWEFTSLNPIVIEDIKLADSIADIVIVAPHWGIEYQTTPSQYQKAWAVEMTEAGADVIIGTHPHVVQPVEWISTESGNESLCFYSLGNYVSTQNQATINMLEAMAWVTFHVDENGISLNAESSGVVPLVDYYTYNPLKYKYTYLLEDFTDELAANHGIHWWGGINITLDALKQHSNDILGGYVLTRSDIETMCGYVPDAS